MGASILAFSAPATAHKCDFDSVEVFPRSGQPLPLNGRIVIMAYALLDPELRSDLGPMELRGKDEEIPLKVLETRNDGTEVTLVPERPLRPTTWYELAGRDGKPIDLQHSTRAQATAWLTEATSDHLPPRWRAAPGVVSSQINSTGGWVRVSVPIDGDEPVGVVVEMGPIGAALPVGDAAPARHFVNVEKGIVVLGSGTCGGLFSVASGRRYWVKITAYDAAGNRSPTRELVITPGAQAKHQATRASR